MRSAQLLPGQQIDGCGEVSQASTFGPSALTARSAEGSTACGAAPAAAPMAPVPPGSHSPLLPWGQRVNKCLADGKCDPEQNAAIQHSWCPANTCLPPALSVCCSWFRTTGSKWQPPQVHSGASQQQEYLHRLQKELNLADFLAHRRSRYPGLKKGLTFFFFSFLFFHPLLHVCRNLFAPGYTETHYSQTGQAQTVSLTHTVSAGALSLPQRAGDTRQEAQRSQ